MRNMGESPRHVSHVMGNDDVSPVERLASRLALPCDGCVVISSCYGRLCAGVAPEGESVNE